MNLQANGYECVAAQKSPGQRAWAFKSILEFLKSPSIGEGGLSSQPVAGIGRRFWPRRNCGRPMILTAQAKSRL
jgi:hypothetical protein